MTSMKGISGASSVHMGANEGDPSRSIRDKVYHKTKKLRKNVRTHERRSDKTTTPSLHPFYTAGQTGEELAPDLNRLLPDAEPTGRLGLPISARILPIAGSVDASGGDDVQSLVASHGQASPCFQAHVVEAPIPWVECEDDHLEVRLGKDVVEADELGALRRAEVKEGDAEVGE